jgi:hypothetical protein
MGGTDSGALLSSNTSCATFDGPIKVAATWSGPITFGTITGNNNCGVTFGNSAYPVEFSTTNATGFIWDQATQFNGIRKVLGGNDSGAVFASGTICSTFDGPISVAANYSGPITFGTINGNNNVAMTFGNSGYPVEFNTASSTGFIFDQGIAAKSNLSISGTLILSGTSGGPSNTTTPAGWVTIMSGTTSYKLPAYQ